MAEGARLGGGVWGAVIVVRIFLGNSDGFSSNRACVTTVRAVTYEAPLPQMMYQSALSALAPLGTDAHKPYLEAAPYLIAVLAERYGLNASGTRAPHYYVMESVSIATEFLLAALHHAGLATPTHTPNPMGFLGHVLQRPANERAVMLVVAGYPEANAKVPDLTRKPLHEIASFR